MILSFMAEDDMNFLGSRTADVRAEHNIVRGITVHVGLVELAVKQLDVSTPAINVLLVLHGELNNQGLVPEQVYRYRKFSD